MTIDAPSSSDSGTETTNSLPPHGSLGGGRNTNTLPQREGGDVREVGWV